VRTAARVPGLEPAGAFCVVKVFIEAGSAWSSSPRKSCRAVSVSSQSHSPVGGVRPLVEPELLLHRFAPTYALFRALVSRDLHKTLHESW